MTPNNTPSDMAASGQGGTPADPPIAPPVTPPLTPPVTPPQTPPEFPPVTPPETPPTPAPPVGPSYEPDPNDAYDPIDPNPDEMDKGNDITPILPGEDDLPGGGTDLFAPGSRPRATPI